MEGRRAGMLPPSSPASLGLLRLITTAFALGRGVGKWAEAQVQQNWEVQSRAENMRPIHGLWRTESLEWGIQVQTNLEKGRTEYQHLEQTENGMLHC